MKGLIFSLHPFFLPLNLCWGMNFWEYSRLCRHIWPTNLRWISDGIWPLCVEPGVGISLSFLRCTFTACPLNEPYTTTTVCTPHLPRAPRLSQQSLKKRDPSCPLWLGICSVGLMPRVKACHGTFFKNTYQPSRFCFSPPEVAESGSRSGANMFDVPLRPARGPVSLEQDEPNEVIIVDSPRSETPSPLPIAHSAPTTPREHQTETAEIKAKRILEAPDGPSKAQLLDLFESLPRSLYRRTDGGDGGYSTSFVVGGVNPRSSSLPLHLCSSHPCFVRTVTRFIKAACPGHKFSTFVLRRGCSGRIHRDCKNGPCPSLLIGLNDQLEGDGLWIHDKVGSCMKRHLGQDLWGTVVPIQTPFVFDARKTLHAGHLSDATLAPFRVVLVAFTTLNARFASPVVRANLEDLGFPLPTAEDMHMQDRTILGECPKRLRQLTFHEALHLTKEVDEAHDVIEVLDSQD